MAGARRNSSHNRNATSQCCILRPSCSPHSQLWNRDGSNKRKTPKRPASAVSSWLAGCCPHMQPSLKKRQLTKEEKASQCWGQAVLLTTNTKTETALLRKIQKASVQLFSSQLSALTQEEGRTPELHQRPVAVPLTAKSEAKTDPLREDDQSVLHLTSSCSHHSQIWTNRKTTRNIASEVLLFLTQLSQKQKQLTQL